MAEGTPTPENGSNPSRIKRMILSISQRFNRTELPKQNELGDDVTPREILGLNRYLMGESWGGNAGDSSAGAHARYLGNGKFEFSTLFNVDGRPRGDLYFRAISPTLDDIRKEYERKQVEIPALINAVFPEPHVKPNLVAVFQKRAVEHNTDQVIKYLKAGGDPKLLPKTSFITDINQLKEIATKV